MSYNFFRDARSISNSFLCRYDNVDGYATDLTKNGDVDGWDLYHNIYLYGSWEGKLFVFEDVPARVCRQCGEKYFDSQTVKAMEKAVLTELEPKRTIRVPVFSFPDVAAA